MIAAMKYVIKPLKSHCIDYLLDKVISENVFPVIQFCMDFNIDSRLMIKYGEFLRNQTETVLKTESFTKISHKCLTLLLELNALNISEAHLFKAVCYTIS